MNVEQIIEQVSLGHRCKVSLTNNAVWLDGKKMEMEWEQSDKPLNEVLDDLSTLYWLYKHSRPTTVTMHMRRSWFRPLSIERLTEQDRLYGSPRNVMQATLELRVLEAKMNGTLYWDKETMGDDWYWHGRDKDFVIRKNWIESK